MSTLLDSSHSNPLYSQFDLLHYFQDHAKCRECMRVGVEAEFFAVDRRSGQALPYKGEVGIESILKVLAQHAGYEAIYEGEAIIALKKGDNMVTLEPGGQVELSAPPVKTVFEVDKQISGFLDELKTVLSIFPGVRFLAAGCHPFSSVDQVLWVPKKRYAIMAEYLSGRGSLAHHMMKLTATNQINLDYYSEEHAMSSLRTVFGISPVVSAMFCNAPFSEGKPNGFLSRRLEIWRHTDPERTGILYDFLQPGRSFRDYLNYVLDMPLIFIVRGSKWIPMKGMPFRKFISVGYDGHPATVADFELHLSTAFPDVRLKQYIEIRSMDGQKPYLISSLAAFWKGIMYDAETRENAWRIVSFASETDWKRLVEEVPKQGMRAKFGRHRVSELARELVELACTSLARQTTPSEIRSECYYIERIREEILDPLKSPAEQLLDKWYGPLNQDPARLMEDLSMIPFP